MGYDYGDMMREERDRQKRKQKERSDQMCVEKFGKKGDPKEFAVELARGREAIEQLKEIRRAYKKLVGGLSR